MPRSCTQNTTISSLSVGLEGARSKARHSRVCRRGRAGSPALAAAAAAAVATTSAASCARAPLVAAAEVWRPVRPGATLLRRRVVPPPATVPAAAADPAAAGSASVVEVAVPKSCLRLRRLVQLKAVELGDWGVQGLLEEPVEVVAASSGLHSGGI